MASQKERILGALQRYRTWIVNEDPGHGDGSLCSSLFLDHWMPRYAARINELRNEGHNIVTVGICKTHKTAVYRLEATDD